MNNPNAKRFRLAMRGLLERLEALPDDEEPLASDVDALEDGLVSAWSQQVLAEEMKAMRAPRITPRPVALALQPLESAWTLFVRLPANVKPGSPVHPLLLNAGAVTYQLHVGFNYLPVNVWDGVVPDTLAAQYSAGDLVVTAPGGKPVDTESLTLLWSRARTLAFSVDERTTDKPREAARDAELARILQRIPKGSGTMRKEVEAMVKRHAPAPKFVGPKPAPFLTVKARQAALRAKALAAGEPDPVHEQTILEAHGAPAQDLTVNSFGKVKAS